MSSLGFRNCQIRSESQTHYPALPLPCNEASYIKIKCLIHAIYEAGSGLREINGFSPLLTAGRQLLLLQ